TFGELEPILSSECCIIGPIDHSIESMLCPFVAVGNLFQMHYNVGMSASQNIEGQVNFELTVTHLLPPLALVTCRDSDHLFVECDGQSLWEEMILGQLPGPATIDAGANTLSRCLTHIYHRLDSLLDAMSMEPCPIVSPIHLPSSS